MRIISANLNGIRSAASKGFFTWLASQEADVVCLQELKAQITDLSREMLQPGEFHGYFHCAEKKGYSGVGIYARKQPDVLIEGLGISDIDSEGRCSLFSPHNESSRETRQVAASRARGR